MLINVTPEDIANGARCDDSHCPIALALVRECKEDNVTVSLDAIYVGPRRFDAPSAVSRFVVDFDEARPVTPFTFILPTE